MNWLRERREQLGLNQEELAAQLQIEGVERVTRVSISNWETGRHKPPLNNPYFRMALAKVLKMSVKEILKLSGFEIQNAHTDEAERAAYIVDQLSDKDRSLVLKILEQFLEQESQGV